MSLKIGSNNIGDVYVGSDKIGKIYVGSDLVYSAGPKPFATATWDEINTVVQSGKAPTYYALGDEKTITLSTGESVVLQIIGFGPNTEQNGVFLTSSGGTQTAKYMTIAMKNCLNTKYVWNTSNVQTGMSYLQSSLRSTVDNTLFGLFPQDLQNIIKYTLKWYYGKYDTKSIYTGYVQMFPYGLIEVGSSGTSTLQTKKYPYWNGKSDADRIKTANGTASGYFTADRYISSIYKTHICYIRGSDGVCGGANMSSTAGVCLVFNI